MKIFYLFREFTILGIWAAEVLLLMYADKCSGWWVCRNWFITVILLGAVGAFLIFYDAKKIYKIAKHRLYYPNDKVIDNKK